MNRVVKHMSEEGNQHNNGPHQDKIFDNPSALCLSVWAKNWIWLGVGGQLMHPIGCLRREYDFVSAFFLFSFIFPPVRVTLFKAFQM